MFGAETAPKQNFYSEISNTTDFHVVSQSPAFIDKTLLIKELLLSTRHYWYILAPPGYGKSTNLSMVKRFVGIDVDRQTGEIPTFNDSENYRIFNNRKLKIYKEKAMLNEYFGQFIVINLSLNNVYANTIDLLLRNYAEALSQTFKEHWYLRKSRVLLKKERHYCGMYQTASTNLTQTDLVHGITFLANMLVKHHRYTKKVFLCVDDYDYPFNKCFIENYSYVAATNLTFFKSVYQEIQKSSRVIVRGLYVGTTGFSNIIVKYLGNIQRYDTPTLHQFNKYFGCLEAEVTDLLQRFNCYTNEFVEHIVMHYGCELGPHGITGQRIVCTSTMMKYLDGLLDSIYQRRGPSLLQLSKRFTLRDDVSNLIKNHLKSPLIRHKIEKLLTGQWIDMTLVLNNLDFATDSLNLINSDTLLPSLFFPFLKSNGLLSFHFTNNYYAVVISNKFTLLHIYDLVKAYYGEELNQQLETGSHLLNGISINSTYNFYYNFLMKFRQIAAIYSQKYPNIPSMSIQCLADILYKTKFESTVPLPTIHMNFPSDFHGAFVKTEADGLTVSVFCFNAEYEIPIATVLAHAINYKDNLQCVRNIEQQIYIGISTDREFKFAIGWLTGSTDISQAHYVSFQEARTEAS